MGREFTKFINSMAKLADDIERQERREEKAKQAEIRKKLQAQKKNDIILSKTRKELAKLRGYVFEKCSNNDLREKGLLKDYIYYQYFAMPEEQKEDLTQEQLNEILINDYETKAEWRADNIPIIERNKYESINNNIKLQEENKNKLNKNSNFLQELLDSIIRGCTLFIYTILGIIVFAFILGFLAFFLGG